MNNGIHFIAGLPRAGSTLLAAILRQNPRFHARMTGPLAGWVMTMLGAMSVKHDTGTFITDRQRKAVLRGLFDAYYEDIHPTKVVFDTSRLWCARLPTLSDLFPRARIVCCVRHVGWIIDSMERLIRRNKYQMSKIFNFEAGDTVYSRAAILTAPNGLVGSSLSALKEAYYGEESGRLLFVTFENLTRFPARVVSAIYDFIEEPAFTHDFDALHYDEAEFDARIGTPGLHTIAPQVRAVERQTILPPDLFMRFERDAFWADPAMNLRQVRVI